MRSLLCTWGLDVTGDNGEGQGTQSPLLPLAYNFLALINQSSLSFPPPNPQSWLTIKHTSSLTSLNIETQSGKKKAIKTSSFPLSEGQWWPFLRVLRVCSKKSPRRMWNLSRLLVSWFFPSNKWVRKLEPGQHKPAAFPCGSFWGQLLGWARKTVWASN